MTDSVDTRVAVYIDFDNIVISRYDQLHGRGQFQKDRARGFDTDSKEADPEITDRLARATVDVGAIIDFASSFGTLVLTRAYADWSASVNADYRGQLVSRAVDLVQLFPTAAYSKNGADIRLAVDAVEDMFRLPDLTHVVIVAGDSDYIPLAQRCRRLGNYVVGIGVAGSTSKSLAAACDEFATYDALPGIEPGPSSPPRSTGSRSRAAKSVATAAPAGDTATTDAASSTTTSSPSHPPRWMPRPTFPARRRGGPRPPRRRRSSRTSRRTRRMSPRACSSARCGSGTRRRTRTGCTALP
jgi:uncharacterized LabA/DUF88 family protein